MKTETSEIKVATTVLSQVNIDTVFDTVDKAKEVAIAWLTNNDTPKLTKLTLDAKTHTPRKGEYREGSIWSHGKYITYEYEEQTGKWKVEYEH